jgi:hypothetical protein
VIGVLIGIGSLVLGLTGAVVYLGMASGTSGDDEQPVATTPGAAPGAVAPPPASGPLLASAPKTGAVLSAAVFQPAPQSPPVSAPPPEVNPLSEPLISSPTNAVAAPQSSQPTPAKTMASLLEAQLQEQLGNVPELKLPGVDTVRGLEIDYANQRDTSHKRNLAWETRIAGELKQLWREASNAGLPFHTGLSAYLHPGPADTLARGTVELHLTPRVLAESGQQCFMNAVLKRNVNGQVSILDPKSGKQVVTLPGLPRSALRPVEDLRKLFEITWPGEKVENNFDVVPVITQVLQPENPEYRALLVEELGRIPGAEAGVALARRALYDTSAAIRESAIAMLKQRPAAQYRATVLDGFRYPWAPVADHAADVLVQTHDQQAVPKLKEIAARPDPTLPYVDEKSKKHEVRELVRINHMQNCCLCHAPSYNAADWVPGRVMEPGKPIPAEYYGAPHGAFVRADITFLRQDFSTTQRVIDAQPWPEQQRFDYVVRTRQATFDEMSRLEKETANASYPQRDAALRALRQLSGNDTAAASDPAK